MSDELGFNSKVDLSILVALLTAVAVCIVAVAMLWDIGAARGWLLPGLLMLPLAVGILLPLWILVSLRYFLSGDTLRVRCGPFAWRIALRDIQSIVPSQEGAAGPALSFDRLRIDRAGGKPLIISPEPRAEFLRQLEHRRARSA